MHDEASVIEYLPPLFRDEPAVDEDGVDQRDLDEAVRREDGWAREEGRSDARVHEVFDGVEVGRVVDDVRLFSGASISILHEAVNEELAVEHDERFILQIGNAEGMPLCERMVGTCDKGTLTVKEFCVGEPCAEVRRIVRQGEVEFLLLDHLQGAHAARLNDLELDLGMLRAELTEDVREKDDAELQRHGDAHLRMAMRHVADLIVEARDLREDVGNLAEEFCPVCRHGDLAPLAVKEVQPRLRLECLHGDGDGRLGDMQMLCRLRNVLPLTHLVEISHLNQRHGIISFRASAATERSVFLYHH